ncbi:AlpA family phage regulatory protein [Candidatus Woesearchaeota archaeon]|nr:AlpA family phage regulatory protein [Candidatus Woesearchaeota archaeon]
MNENFVRIEYLMQKFAIKRSTVYVYIANGDVPKGKKISHKMTVWVQSAVDTAFLNFCEKKGILI